MFGTIAKIVEDRGYGFIDGEDSRRYFVHHSQADRFDDLGEGQRVSFEVEESDKGPRAIKVAAVPEPVVAATADIPSQEGI